MTALISLFAIASLTLALLWVRHRLQQKRAALVAKVDHVSRILDDFELRFAQEYVSRSELSAWMKSLPSFGDLLLTARELRLLRSEDRMRYDRAASLLEDPDTWVADRNRALVATRMEEVRRDAFRGKAPQLTDAQLEAAVTNEDNNLVLAGAGSGKTTTITARTAYLIRWGLAEPHEILVMAFNRSVAKEISRRLDDMGIRGVEVATFHGKGYQILAKLEGRKPAISALAEDDEARKKFLQGLYDGDLADNEYFGLLSRWWTDFRVPYDQLDASETRDELLRREDSWGLRSLAGVRMKSQAERQVADWLSLHGIPWEYESRYPHTPSGVDKRDYTPDFFLPDSNIWIEVWACDRAGSTRDDIDPVKYKEKLEWAEGLHERHETSLVGVFQDEFRSGRLGEYLARKLSYHGLEPRLIDEEARAVLLGSGSFEISQFVGLVDSFLNLMRGGLWTREEIERRAISKRDHAFLKLFWPFLDAYEAELEGESKIDFHEMLARGARKDLRALGVRQYKHLLVDEFQDISTARLRLLEALRDKSKFGRTFLVGDDWQSIYHFAGADPSILIDLEKRLGPTEVVKLDRTFRLGGDVTAVSSNFVSENPGQFKKDLLPVGRKQQEPGVCVCVHKPGEEAKALAWCLSTIAGSGLDPVDALILGRYRKTLEYELPKTSAQVLSNELQLRPFTIHQAKGLEADYAIILGLESGTYGFPAEIADDPVLRLVTGPLDEFPNAEERRLFYVALTRTRNRVFLLTPVDHPSSFVQELREDAYAPYTEWVGRESALYRCPRCLGKTIRRKTGEAGPFWACLHFPRCEGKLPGCSHCDEGVLEPQVSEGRISHFRCTKCKKQAGCCPLCGTGALLVKAGIHGKFLGCWNWRRDGSGCKYTRNLNRETASPFRARA